MFLPRRDHMYLSQIGHDPIKCEDMVMAKLVPYKDLMLEALSGMYDKCIAWCM